MKIKKLLIIAVLSCIGAMGFSGVMFQQDLDGVGLGVDFNHTCFDQKNPNAADAYFVSFSSFSGTLGFEFKTGEIENPFHFFTGAGAGFCSTGFPVFANGGFSYRLKDFGYVSLELSSNLKLGVVLGLYGECDAYAQISADVILQGSKRRGLYGGIGLTSSNIPALSVYKGYGTVFELSNYTGLRCVAGIRF